MQIETCRKVENVLKRFDRKESNIRVLPFHAALEQESRLANIEEFRSSRSKNISMFLVCTDRYDNTFFLSSGQPQTLLNCSFYMYVLSQSEFF